MKKIFSLICIFLLFTALNISAQVYEEVHEFDDVLTELNEEDFLKEKEEVEKILNKISQCVSKLSTKFDLKLDLQDLNTEEFRQASLSEQLKLFKTNYESLNNFVIESQRLLQENSKDFMTFFSLQTELYVHYGKLMTISEKIMNSMSQDLKLALESLKEAEKGAEKSQHIIDNSRLLAEQLIQENKRLKGQRWTFGVIGILIGGVAGGLMMSQLNK